MKLSAHTRSLPGLRGDGGRRGFVAILVMLLLCWIAVLGGLRALVVANAAVVSRACDSARQEEAFWRRLERVVEEATLARVESGRSPSALVPADEARARLDELDAGGASVEVVEAPEPAVSEPYPGPVAPSLGMPGAGLCAVAGPQLREMLGERTAEHPVGRWTFIVDRTVIGVRRRVVAHIEARVVEVPLSRYPVFAYELPSEIGEALAQDLTDTPASLLAPGLAAGRDRAQLATLLVDGARPYHYRRRASLSVLCQYLGSQSFVNRAALLAGPALRHELGAPERETATLAGLSRVPGGAVLDLALAGSGTWNGQSGAGNIVVISVKEPGAVVTLVDEEGNPELDPIVLLVVGEPGGGLSIEVGPVSRPTVLFAFNASLRAPGGGDWNGALFLDPGSSFPATGASPLRVAHLSYATSSTNVSARAVQAGLPIPSALEALMPRVHYVCAARTDP